VLIAVTGSTGEMGRRVAERLAARDVPMRLIVRDAARAPDIRGAEVAEASDYGATDEMRRALEGADTLFLVPGRESANRIEQHTSAVDAAVAAGVGRIVYLSFVDARPDTTFTLGRHHWATEEHIRSTGVPFSFPRMQLYMDFLPTFAGADGVIRGPAGEGRLAAVHRDDVADVAAVVLTEEGHEGRSFDITGPEAFTLAEAADVMSRLSGKRIVFEDQTREEAFASRAGYGAPDWEVEGWVTSYEAIRNGDLDVVTTVVRDVAGHPPITLEEYLRATPEAFAHVTGAPPA
jgi:NAD(P)H dehydrogenase (quinone)